jgi:hypothetical protein
MSCQSKIAARLYCLFFGQLMATSANDGKWRLESGVKTSSTNENIDFCLDPIIGHNTSRSSLNEFP